MGIDDQAYWIHPATSIGTEVCFETIKLYDVRGNLAYPQALTTGRKTLCDMRPMQIG
jgi:hypothetical protein